LLEKKGRERRREKRGRERRRGERGRERERQRVIEKYK
jgi:hypothetical protein